MAGQSKSIASNRERIGSEMSWTIRKYWRGLQGRRTLNYNWPAIDRDSTVLITASEYNNDYARFVGDASITVENISPHGPP